MPKTLTRSAKRLVNGTDVVERQALKDGGQIEEGERIEYQFHAGLTQNAPANTLTAIGSRACPSEGSRSIGQRRPGHAIGDTGESARPQV